jgi:hypothetical protein
MGGCSASVVPRAVADNINNNPLIIAKDSMVLSTSTNLGTT